MIKLLSAVAVSAALLLQQEVDIPTDWIDAITKQVPMTAVVFWLLLKYDRKIDNLSNNIAELAKQIAVMVALVQSKDVTK